MLPKHPHILLIAGTGRNSGKTSLACRIIEKFSVNLDITALKISPHLHRETQSLKKLIDNPSYVLYKESGLNPKKDSARMLAAGAKKSYYLEVQDEYLAAAMVEFFKLLSEPVPLVIESPVLIRHLEPGLLILVDNPWIKNKKKEILELKNRADLFIDNGSDIPEEQLRKIRYNTSGWQFEITD